MSNQFSKGPWTIKYTEARPWSPTPTPDQVLTADGYPLMVCGVTSTSWGNPEIDANMRLIAAAPQLYEALKLALHVGTVIEGWEHDEPGQSTRNAFDKLTAALALVDQPTEGQATPETQ